MHINNLLTVAIVTLMSGVRGGVLRISSDGVDRRFFFRGGGGVGVKIFDSGIF